MTQQCFGSTLAALFDTPLLPAPMKALEDAFNNVVAAPIVQVIVSCVGYTTYVIAHCLCLYSLEAHGEMTISTLQVLARRETSVLLQLLRKTIQATLNASNGMSEATQSLVSAAWDLLGRIIHEGGPKARGTSVSPCTACH